MVAWFAGGLALAWIGWLGARRAGARWWKENRRGRVIPATLGWAVAMGAAGLALVVVRQIDADGVRDSQAGELLGAGIVFLAGVVDDGFGGAERGLRGHLRALLAGRLTTGSVKLAAAVLAAAITVAWTPREHLWANLLALIAIAGCTNVWNGLDVAPGRALKGFLVVAVVLLVVDLRAFLLVCTGAACAVLIGLFPTCASAGCSATRARTSSASSPERRSCGASPRSGCCRPPWSSSGSTCSRRPSRSRGRQRL